MPQAFTTQTPAADLDVDALVVFTPESDAPLPEGGPIGAELRPLIDELRASGELKGKAASTFLIPRPAGLRARRLLLAGVGKTDEGLSTAAVRRAAGAAGRALRAKGMRRVACALAGAADPQREAQAIVEGFLAAQFEPDAYKSEGRKPADLDELLLLADPSVDAAVARGAAIAAGQEWARQVALEPGNRLPPRELVARARSLAANTGLEIEILEREQLEHAGFGALLGVAQGSAEPPALIVLRHRPEGASADLHLGLVGKAVTFDTGGISLKPSADMHLMKYDMAGGAAVLGAMHSIAALAPKVNVTAVVPTVENMPGGKAIRPGDVLTSLSGKTIEVLNTDAEGRLILCDALTYAIRQGCNRLVDAATLTGAIVIGLGHERTGLFVNDDAWRDALMAASETAGEKMWPMPLDPEYRELLDSPIADLANIGGRPGGSITAAKFLEAFVDKTPWAHLDIAGTGWLESNKPDMPKGPTGVGVRTFVELALRLAGD